MYLPVPTIGLEQGPAYAQDVNSCMSIIDQHTHIFGQGVQIPSQGLNIQSALTLNNNLLTSAQGVTFQGQGSAPAINTVYNSNNSTGDLYYNNNAGLAIQLTNASGIVGSAGSISGISGTASASYSSPTFFWRSATSIAANLDCASLIMRNISPNSTYALTLSPPSGLASNSALTLPLAPGSGTSFMTMDSTGAMATSVSTLPNYGKSASSGLFSTYSQTLTVVTGMTISITTSGRPVMILLTDDGASSGNTSNIASSDNSATVPTGMFIALFRGVTQLTYSQLQGSPDNTAGYTVCPPGAISFLDTPSAGTYTYSMKVAASVAGPNVQVNQCVLTVYEIR